MSEGKWLRCSELCPILRAEGFRVTFGMLARWRRNGLLEGRPFKEGRTTGYLYELDAAREVASRRCKRDRTIYEGPRCPICGAASETGLICVLCQADIWREGQSRFRLPSAGVVMRNEDYLNVSWEGRNGRP